MWRPCTASLAAARSTPTSGACSATLWCVTEPQHDDHWRGVLSWAELKRRGFSQAQVRRMVAVGDLRALRRRAHGEHSAVQAVFEVVEGAAALGVGKR